MTRVKAEIRWSDEKQAFRAFDAESGEPIAQYTNLRYGDTTGAIAGTADDPDEMAKTITGEPATEARDAVLVGWVTLVGEARDEAGRSPR